MANHAEVSKRIVVEHGPDGAEARFSPDRLHRYQLCRTINRFGRGLDYRRVVFVMLNPSTADAFKLDPTITKCMRIATLLGFDRVDVVNLYSYRTPKPSVLAAHVREGLVRFPNGSDVLEWSGCGTENDAHIICACTLADLVIAAWGNDGHHGGITYDGKTRGAHVRECLQADGIELHHLGQHRQEQPPRSGVLV